MAKDAPNIKVKMSVGEIERKYLHLKYFKCTFEGVYPPIYLPFFLKLPLFVFLVFADYLKVIMCFSLLCKKNY